MRSLSVLCVVLLVSGCSTYMKMDDGTYNVVKDAQKPVAFGVSNSYSMLENCRGTQTQGYHYEKLIFDRCHDVEGSLRHGTAPGWFPSIWSSFMNLIGFGWIASNVGNSTTSSSSAISNSTVNVPAPHHGHGPK